MGSYPGKLELEFIKNNDDVNPYEKKSAGIRLRRRLEDSVGYVPPLVSGNKMDFNVYILDQDGYLYTSDSQSKAVLDKDSPTSDIILLNNEAIAKSGTYHFQNVELRAKPGTKPSLRLAISGLQTFGNELPFTKSPIHIET